MPAKGTTSRRKRHWLSVTEHALNELRDKKGAKFTQQNVIDWLEDHEEYHSPFGPPPAESTIKGYLVLLSRPDGADDAFSLGGCISRGMLGASIPYDALPIVLQCWIGALMGDYPFTMRHAIWTARLIPFFESPEAMRRFVSDYVTEERISEALGESEINTSGLDLRLALAVGKGTEKGNLMISELAQILGIVEPTPLQKMSLSEGYREAYSQASKTDRFSDDMTELISWLDEANAIRAVQDIDEEKFRVFVLGMRLFAKSAEYDEMSSEQRTDFIAKALDRLRAEEWQKFAFMMGTKNAAL